MSESLDQEIRTLRALQGSARDPEGRGFAPLAEAYRRKGDLEEADELVRDGLERLPEFATGHLVAARVARDRGDRKAVGRHLERVLELDGENVAARVERAAHRLAEGDRPGAREDLEAALALEPDHEEATARLEELSFPDEGDPAASGGPEASASPAAVPHAGIEADVPVPPLSDATPVDRSLFTRTMGELYAKQGLLERAVEVFEHLHEADPEDAGLAERLEELRTEAANAPPVVDDDVRPDESFPPGDSLPEGEPIGDGPSVPADSTDVLEGGDAVEVEAPADAGGAIEIEPLELQPLDLEEPLEAEFGEGPGGFEEPLETEAPREAEEPLGTEVEEVLGAAEAEEAPTEAEDALGAEEEAPDPEGPLAFEDPLADEEALGLEEPEPFPESAATSGETLDFSLEGVVPEGLDGETTEEADGPPEGSEAFEIGKALTGDPLEAPHAPEVGEAAVAEADEAPEDATVDEGSAGSGRTISAYMEDLLAWQPGAVPIETLAPDAGDDLEAFTEWLDGLKK